LVIAKLNRRAFPEAVDFVTSPGHAYRGVRRHGSSLPGAGPVKVITDRGVLEPDAETGELVLTAVYPGVTVADVARDVGWPLQCREPLSNVTPPAAADLELLRHRLDPARLFLRPDR
jgi:glutaconate CoA-transferase, subunit B